MLRTSRPPAFPRSAIRRGVVPLALLVSLTSCIADAAPAPTEPGIEWELAELRRRTLSGLAYDVRLRVPAERERPVEGESVLRFLWNDSRRRDVVVDFLDPASRVRSVEANGTEIAWRAENDHIVVPGASLRAGEANALRIVYSAGDASLNRSEDFLYTLFVPERHHFSLPVFDQPNLKGRWRLSVEVPEGWVAVANGEEEAAARQEDGTTRYRFAETRPIPSYLFSFAAGRFRIEEAERGGRRMRMFHRETDDARVARSRERIFDLHARAVEWLEEYTRIGYPFGKLDFVLLPSFQYGGMEHPGAILYRQDALFLDEAATQEDELERASVIAHETAHMWFGDLVTMNWFDDVWTKEVFANFMAGKIVQPSFPGVDFDLRFLLANHPGAYAVDRTAGTNAIRQPLRNLSQAGSLYGNIIYLKAPVVMRQLEGRVGESGLRDGLRAYLSRFAYGNATWPQLIEILDDHTPDDLEAWSRVWVDEPGRPRVRVEREEEDGGTRVTISQEDPEGRGRVWPQRLRVAFPTEAGVGLREIDLDASPVSFLLPGRPAWILPNGGGVEYGLFVMDPASRDALLEGVGAVPEGRVRGAAWVTLWDAVLEGEIPPARFLTRVLSSLPLERDEQVTQRLLGYLQTLYWNLLPDVERGRRGPGVEMALWKGAGDAPTATLRAAYFSAWRETVESPEGVERLRRLWAGEASAPVPISGPGRTRLATALALRGVQGWREILEREEAQIESPDRRARFAFVRPALSADPVERERFFNALSVPANREPEPWALEGLAALNHPLRADSARGFILPALEMMEEVQRTGDVFFPGRWVDATLWGHTDPEAAEIVRAFLATHPDLPPRLRGKIEQASDLLERSARLVYGWKG